MRWVWAAVDADSRQGVAVAAGDRSADTARRLWAALPARYRDRAITCADFWRAYLAAVPEERHAAGGKESGRTTRVERFWGTARQRCRRLVRKALSFSKCDRNHPGALRHFIRHYNQSLL